VRRAERPAEDALDEVSLLVRGAAADDRRRALPRLAEARGRRLQRLLPARRAQLAAAADHRFRDPLRRLDHLVAEAPLVTEPAVVHVVVVAGEDALDLLVANGQLDVALAGTQRADGARLLDLPRPGAEAVGV
jgi:hypothetical protein